MAIRRLHEFPFGFGKVGARGLEVSVETIDGCAQFILDALTV